MKRRRQKQRHKRKKTTMKEEKEKIHPTVTTGTSTLMNFVEDVR